MAQKQTAYELIAECIGDVCLDCNISDECNLGTTPTHTLAAEEGSGIQNGGQICNTCCIDLAQLLDPPQTQNTIFAAGKIGTESSIEDFATQSYSVMKDIAESIYSPVGFLDVLPGVVFMYDKDTMGIISDGNYFYFV